MTKVLYKRQREIINYLKSYIKKRGHAPTLGEIAKKLKVSSLATVHEHLETLEKKGLIKKSGGLARGIELIDKRISNIVAGTQLPVLGFIAAGSPIETYTDPNAFFNVPQSMISQNKKSYVLQVRGDSMVEDGILDGDYVVVEETNRANDGDIVVAMIANGVVTLKRFFKEKAGIKLVPANSNMEPIFVKDVTIQGKCVGVIRKFN